MAVISGIKAVLSSLAAVAKKYGAPSTVCSVGYTQHYAIYVHEDLTAFHPVGQAKFLEEAARDNQLKYAGIVEKALKAGAKLEGAMLLAGLALQRDSQMLCPVDTGALKASAFTRLEGASAGPDLLRPDA